MSDDLLGEDYIKFYDSMYGIWIPAAAILKRRNYEWFTRLSDEQIFQSKFILFKVIFECSDSLKPFEHPIRIV